MAAIVECRDCGKQFRAEPSSIGTMWNPLFAVCCPECGAENRFTLDGGGFDDAVISEMIDDKYAAKKKGASVEERVRLDAVLEYWVQRYIAANYERLGFQGLKGPFDSGPDFQVLHRGKWVHAEAEVACENYIQHKHHENRKWAACKVLIVLSEKKPAPGKRHLLPRTIMCIDKAHFTPWYREAAREYAQAKEREEPANKAAEKMAMQLHALSNEIRARFGVPHGEDGGEDQRLFAQLALEFVAGWITGTELKLAEIRSADIDEFCRNVATLVHEREANTPVFCSRYCKACDKTLIIRSSRVKGFADYDKVVCPHCHTNLGEIRSDVGFQIVAVENGNLGNREWQDPETTRQFVGKHPDLH